MNKFSLQVLENTKEASDSIRVKFVKPDIHYKPGQYMIYELPVQDPKGPARDFSLASSPTEDFLMLTTKLTGSPFKQKLAQLRVGDVIDASGPFGGFTIADGPRHLFVAGGIGITPFRSMIKFATDRKLQQEITLLYSNKVPEEIAFRDELEKWRQQNENLKVVHTITRPEESAEKWNGRTGRVDAGLIKENLDAETVVYVCGPPAMVDAILALLKDMDVPEQRTRAEKFEGY
ncbi:MAG: FAD-dependent oxidoreductase [Candidatus Aenigmarchaeota archaeon]|nr:FAD-dependent oxidoreductase [Candidatus Aenigmarchaeota archaeon]